MTSTVKSSREHVHKQPVNLIIHCHDLTHKAAELVIHCVTASASCPSQRNPSENIGAKHLVKYLHHARACIVIAASSFALHQACTANVVEG